MFFYCILCHVVQFEPGAMTKCADTGCRTAFICYTGKVEFYPMLMHPFSLFDTVFNIACQRIAVPLHYIQKIPTR